MAENTENMDSGFVIALIVVFLIGMIVGGSVCSKRYSANPRQMHGVDTLATRDSFYPIHFTIDTAIEMPYDDEPPEDPRR